MFKKTNPQRQLSFFGTVSQYLSDKSKDLYSKEDAWHNIFYREVVCRIDEDLFAPLFCQDNGAPNQSVRLLVGMMIIKEGKGISDEELFENVRFDLLIRKALGLLDLDDPVPAPSTYYLFRQRLKEHFEDKEDDLLEKCFEGITKGQATAYNVSGKSVRLDSKLIGSNIAFYSRYTLVHKTLLLFCKEVDTKWLSSLPSKLRSRIDRQLEENTEKTVYVSDSATITRKLQSLGKLIYDILNFRPIADIAEYEILRRVFQEQFRIDPEDDNDNPKPKEGKEIEATSVQSPYDSECTYRKKNEESTKGYSHNLTETCDEGNEVNLITNVQTEPATKADNEFVEDAVESTQDVLNQKVENTHADGAYNSQGNQAFMDENNMNFYLTGFQGPPPRYKLTREDDKVKCYDTQQGQELELALTKKGKYRIKIEKGYRYFTDNDIQKQELRRAIEQLPSEIANKRNNVEASIYQLAYPLRKDKTKYRGLFKNKIWAILRCTWVNCVRIGNFIAKKLKSGATLDQITVLTSLICCCFKIKPLRIA